MINQLPPLNEDYNWDPNTKALKRRGRINHGSTSGCKVSGVPIIVVSIFVSIIPQYNPIFYLLSRTYKPCHFQLCWKVVKDIVAFLGTLIIGAVSYWEPAKILFGSKPCYGEELLVDANRNHTALILIPGMYSRGS